MSHEHEPLLDMRGVTKRFGEISVLRGVDMSIGASEAVGLIGDNGAGKSTLVKILSGIHTPDAGTMRFAGQEAHNTDPLAARTAGIEMIHQDLGLCEDLDAASNVFLGREPRRSVGPFRILDRRRMRHEAGRIFTALGADVNPDQAVGSMSGGQRQLVAVARALEFDPKLLLMDEPTAALSNTKIHMLLDLVRQLKARGVAILLISHRFTDLISVCDRIMALRDGLITASLEPRGRDVGVLMAEMQTALTGEDQGEAA